MNFKSVVGFLRRRILHSPCITMQSGISAIKLEMKDFKDKVAVITGAASGIGKGLAHHCALQEMKIVLAE